MKVLVRTIKEFEVDVDDKFRDLLSGDRLSEKSHDLQNELWHNIANNLNIDPGLGVIRSEEDLRKPGLLEIRELSGKLIVER